MKPANTDPHVSCPIVCGEYMRATGFFFTANNQTYLITARHNFLPTDATELNTGNFPLTFQTNDRLPTIDIYLKNGDTFDVERINAFDKQGLLFDEGIDVIGIPITFDPEQYGYVLWTPDDIADPNTTQTTLDVMGYPGASFPESNEYNTNTYAREITNPYVLNLRTDFQTHAKSPTDTGHLAVGVDTDQSNSDTDYQGYSGSPVLNDGLTGIHCANIRGTAIDPKTSEATQTSAVAFWRAEVLEVLLNKL
jgi:hypothetical protein